MLLDLFRRPVAQPERASREEVILRAVAEGGARFERLVFTRNRRVMASVVDSGRVLRLQESFRDAPPEIHRALGTLFSRRAPRQRERARGEIRGYLASLAPAPSPPPRARRPYRAPATDLPHLERLRREFQEVNHAFFGGRLPAVAIRLSGRMRRRNGHFSSEPLEIAIARSLCHAAAEGEAERTLRHEMIHLWQWFEGGKASHGSDFRRWARRLGITPRASRTVCWSEESDF